MARNVFVPQSQALNATLYTRKDLSYFAHSLFEVRLCATLAGSKSPSGQTVGNVSCIARSAAETIVEVVVIDRARVIHSRSCVERSASVVMNSVSSLG